MPIREIGRYAAVFCFLAAGFSFLFAGRNVTTVTSGFFWAGIIVTMILFKGWPQVFAFLARQARRAEPHVQRGVGAVWNKAQQYPLIAGAIVSGLIAFYCFATGKPMGSFFFLILAVALAILSQTGPQHFRDNWKEYWLGVSLYGALHFYAFGQSSIASAFGFSALFALITILNGWPTIFSFCGKVLSGRFGWVAMWSGWFALTFFLLWLAAPAGIAYYFGILAVGAFIGIIFAAGAKFVKMILPHIPR